MTFVMVGVYIVNSQDLGCNVMPNTKGRRKFFMAEGLEYVSECCEEKN